MRFGERIAYDVRCDVNREKVQVPAYTFQPLVENAIIHGLSKKEEGGRIRIRAGMLEGALHIYIGDTGKGMTEEALEELRMGLRGEAHIGVGKQAVQMSEQRNMQSERTEKSHQVGIGMGNIYRRIIAMYPKGNMEIYSKHLAGTVIKLVIPQEIAD